MRVHIHLGAHKTATTYMQSLLRENRDNLEKGAGIRFVDLWGKQAERRKLRNGINRIVWSGEDSPATVKRVIGDLRGMVFPGASEGGQEKLVVMSYENIMGSYNIAKSGGLYENVGAGVGLLLEAFSDCELCFYFSYRSTDEFIESCYLQCVHTQKEKRDFDTFYANLDQERLSWIAVVDEIATLAGSGNIRLWSYEKFREMEWLIWDDFLGTKDSRDLLVNKAKGRNRSLTREGIELMLMANRLLDAGDARATSHFLKSQLRKSKGYSPARYLPAEERERLRKGYVEDCDRIGQTWPESMLA